MSVPELNPLPRAFAARLHDERLLQKCTSGGVFTACAEHIIGQGGYVCGAVLTETFSVRHQLAHDRNGICGMRGSKYVISSVRHLFPDIQRLLGEGQRVLFSGTPCQVAALKKFLGVSNDLLLTLDLFCYGVTMEIFWQSYLAYIGEKMKSPPREILFRYKQDGEKPSCLRIVCTNNRIYSGQLDQDPFYLGFFRNYAIRKPCFTCPFAALQREGDISIGDYWGVEAHHPELDAGNGMSALLVNSSKGERLLAEVGDSLDIHPTEIPYVTERNPCLRHPAAMPLDYDVFQQDLSRLSFSDLRRRYLRPRVSPLWRRLLRRLLRRLCGYLPDIR